MEDSVIVLSAWRAQQHVILQGARAALHQSFGILFGADSRDRGGMPRLLIEPAASDEQGERGKDGKARCQTRNCSPGLCAAFQLGFTLGNCRHYAAEKMRAGLRAGLLAPKQLTYFQQFVSKSTA